MVVAPVVLVALLLGAENDAAPARGSVEGPWAFIDLDGDGSLNVSASPAAAGLSLGGDLALVGGFGFQAGSVRLSPTARFSIGPRFFINPAPTGNLAAVTWSPLELAMAAPDLLNDTRLTGLRLTPIFGITIPTTPSAFGAGTPLTTITAAGQLERRLGPVELAYRLEGNVAPCFGIQEVSGLLRHACPTNWTLGNRLFGEAWLGQSFSIALGLAWSIRWPLYPRIVVPGCPVAGACDVNAVSVPPTHRLSAQALGSWAFTERFGTTLEVNFSHTPSSTPGLGWGVSVIGGSLSFWFRTDAVLQRNWLDR